MEVTYQKEKNVINMKTSFALLFLFLLSISGKLYAQEAYIDYHLLIKVE
jgi:hypothetical protein